MKLATAACVAALAAVLVGSYGPERLGSAEEIATAYGGKAVLVCGASYGIGAEIAYGFARANARIVITARSQGKLDAVAARCRKLGAAEVLVHAADLSTKEGCKGLIDATTTRLGGVDVLILNHVVGFYEDWGARIMRAHAGGSLDDDLRFADKIFQVNVLSYVYISSYALPALAASSGRIIAVGSAAGRQGLPRVAPYSASKHAVFGYFDSLRQDLVASADPGLRGVSITTGVLGSFNTETAREGTKGLLDDGLVTWYPPKDAADGLILAGARRRRDVYVPWEQTRIATLIHPLMPTFMDWVIRCVVLSGEGSSAGVQKPL